MYGQLLNTMSSYGWYEKSLRQSHNHQPVLCWQNHILKSFNAPIHPIKVWNYGLLTFKKSSLFTILQRIWTEILHDIAQNNSFIKYGTAKKFLKINTRNILSYKHHPYNRQYYSFEKLRTTSSNLSEIKDHDTW